MCGSWIFDSDYRQTSNTLRTNSQNSNVSYDRGLTVYSTLCHCVSDVYLFMRHTAQNRILTGNNMYEYESYSWMSSHLYTLWMKKDVRYIIKMLCYVWCRASTTLRPMARSDPLNMASQSPTASKPAHSFGKNMRISGSLPPFIHL